MTLRHFKIFRQVCREGSVTKAAAVLGMTQPTISVAISELENFYDVRLFDRMNRKMYLTPAGERLEKYADNILNEFDESVNIIRDTGARKCMKVGMTSNFAAGFLTAATKEFKKLYPGINLISYAYDSSTILELLNKNEIELAVIDCAAPPNVLSREIYKDEYVLLCSEELSELLPNPISPEDMDGIDLILPSTPNSANRPFYNWFMEKRIAPNVILYTASSHTMETTVHAGLGTLPILRSLAVARMAHEAGFARLEFSGDKPSLIFNLCTQKGKNVDEVMQAYIDILIRICK